MAPRYRHPSRTYLQNISETLRHNTITPVTSLIGLIDRSLFNRSLYWGLLLRFKSIKLNSSDLMLSGLYLYAYYMDVYNKYHFIVMRFKVDALAWIVLTYIRSYAHHSSVNIYNTLGDELLSLLDTCKRDLRNKPGLDQWSVCHFHSQFVNLRF